MHHSKQLEKALLAHSSVAECALLQRETESGDKEWVAFVVPSEPLSPEDLSTHLASAMGGPDLPRTFVSVTSIPLTDAGEVDCDILSRLEVLDGDDAQRLENRLTASARVAEAAVILEATTPGSLPLHLSAILPKSKSEHPASTPVEGASAARSARGRVPAITHGGDLETLPNDPVTLPEALRRAAKHSTGKGVVYIRHDGSEEFQSYAELMERAERLLAGLRQLGLEPGDRLIFQFEGARDFIEAFWGSALGGYVPVPMAVAPSYKEQNSAIHTLRNAWRLLERPLILTSEELAPRIARLGESPGFEGLRVISTDQMGGLTPDHRWYDSAPDDLALLMLTSGSTGMPKGVMLNHSNLLGRAAGSRQMNHFSADDISLNWMPLDHVAGLIYFHLRDVFIGCRQVHVPTDLVIQNALQWPALLHRYRATVTFAPNFAFGLVNDRAAEIRDHQWDLSCVRYVLNGAESIVAKTARAFLELLGAHGLPPTSMRPAWGMSETSSGVTYSDRFSLQSSSDEDSFVEVGRPIPGVSLRIVDDRNRIVAEGDIGRLQVCGSTITPGYFNDTGLNATAFTEDGWFNTGDLGILNEGRLTITGREKDVVIVNSVNYYCHAIESAVEDLDEVETSYTAACAVRDPDTDTDKLAVFFHSSVSEDEHLAALMRKLRGRIRAKIGLNPDYLIPVAREVIPKTSIGKIQRTQLARRLESGEFAPTLERVDQLLGNSNTIPDWFYRKRWCRKEALAYRPLSESARVLLFTDALGLATALGRRLAQDNVPRLEVEMGSSFEALAVDRFRIRPSCPDDYLRLVEACEAVGGITHVVHLWNYTAYGGEPAEAETLHVAQESGLYSLLWLVKALAGKGSCANPVRIVFVGSYTQPVLADEPVAYEKSPALGLIKSVPQELPWIQCRHVDLHPSDPPMQAEQIVREMCAIQEDREIAYRDGKRFISRLQKVEFRAENVSELPFVAGGSYVVTGGLGGIGLEMVRYLRRAHDARILILGRTHLEQGSPISEPAQRSATYRSVESLGRVAYEALDVCDRDALQHIVEHYESQWERRFDGVIHLAGNYHEGLIVDESPDSVESMLRARVLGTWTLHSVFESNPGALFVCSSSVAGYFGGASVGAYSSANNFLEAFSAHQRRHGTLDHYCFAWSTWENTGQSRDYKMKDLPRSRGYQSMPAEQAMNAFLIGMRYRERDLLVGLDERNRHIRRHVQAHPRLLRTLHGYYTESGKRDDVDIEVRDRFGTITRCELIKVTEMPRTAGGEIDREALTLSSGRLADASTVRTAPRNDLEQRLAGLWKRVLSVPRVAVEDSFFELGGDSVLAVRILSQIRDETGVELSVRAFFEAQTLADLALAVASEQARGVASPGSEFHREQSRDAALAEDIDQLTDAQVDALLSQMVQEDGRHS